MSEVLLVTGGSRGIGAATAICAAKKGCDIAINYARDANAANKVAEEVKALGRRSMEIKGDMTSEDDILNMFEQVEKDLGQITGLVNSAGTTGKTARVQDMTASAIRAIMELNVVASFVTIRQDRKAAFNNM